MNNSEGKRTSLPLNLYEGLPKWVYASNGKSERIVYTSIEPALPDDKLPKSPPNYETVLRKRLGQFYYYSPLADRHKYSYPGWLIEWEAKIPRTIAESKTFQFQPELKQLLSLSIDYSFYKNKEIFLRELISNASNALDRIQIESMIVCKSKLDRQPRLFIDIIADKAKNTLSITDSGVGMTKVDLVTELGIISRSETYEFIAALAAPVDVKIINKYSLGFYSAYLVADKVVVTTKHNDDEQYVWESHDGEFFTVIRDTSEEVLRRGTKIVLQLRKDQLEYLEEIRLKDLIQKQSEFINYPIYLSITTEIEKEISDDEDEEEKKDEEGKVEEVDEEKEKKEKKKKKIKEVSHVWSLFNEKKPNWIKRLEEIPKDKYNEFYESFSKNLKLEICEDSQYKSLIAELLRYQSTKSGDELTSLKEYVTRKKDSQSDIYYITGESKKAVENSPFLEKLTKKDYEVIYMVDAIDENVIAQLNEFQGNKFVSATKEGLKLEETKSKERAVSKDNCEES